MGHRNPLMGIYRATLKLVAVLRAHARRMAQTVNWSLSHLELETFISLSLYIYIRNLFFKIE